ncbi:GGDEF domain-containing protein [Trichothermofontia sp.]
MEDFRQVLYEALLVAFAKVLAKYNVFAQSHILRDVGQEIIQYLNQHGFEFEETGQIEDLDRLTDLFVKNGFADELAIEPTEGGKNYVWKNLYGFNAYKELFEIVDNPFLSCPLNLCLYYLADKYGKKMLLHRKLFDLGNRITESQYEVVDKNSPADIGFDPLILENAKLYELAQKKGEIYRYQAITDALTGISNRRYILEEGERTFHRTRRYHLSLSVIIIDIDHFKHINDTYGHATGDVTLRMLADTCQRSARDVDLIGRLGGEEFLLILPETPLSGAVRLAERLRQAVEKTQIEADNGTAVRITVSMGVAAYHGDKQLQDLLDRADVALDRAKELGRNQVVVASMPDGPNAVERPALEMEGDN